MSIWYHDNNLKSNIIAFLLMIAMFQAHVLSGNIIYVYLSSKIPDYVFVGLEQTRLFNPNTDIFLIANQEALDQCNSILEQHAIIAVAAESLSPSGYHQQFCHTSTLDTHSYNGLWRKSTERFFYLQELIASRHLKSVVHLEADVMLYVDITELQPAFSRYNGIAAVFDCDYRCITSLIYIPDEKAINHLIDYIAQHAWRGLFDMHIIAHYRNTFSADYVDNLPLIMPEYLQHRSLINNLGHGTSRAQSYCNNIECFQSIFDAAAIGQYLGGLDPVHGTPKPGFINETCLFDVSSLQYEWCKDAQGRNVPFAIFNNARYRINNLHIHSKQLHLFKS